MGQSRSRNIVVLLSDYGPRKTEENDKEDYGQRTNGKVKRFWTNCLKSIDHFQEKGLLMSLSMS